MSNLTIQWTKEEAAYLGEFQALCDKYLEDYREQEEPDDPTRTFWTCNVDTKFMKELAKRFPDIQARLSGGDWEYWRRMYLEDGGIQYLTNQLENRMKAHFAVVGYDFENIPPSPYTDYTPIKVKYWVDEHRYFVALREGREIPYESVRVVGGILVQSSLWMGTRTWTISDATTGRKIPYQRTQTGSKQAKKAMDEEVLKQAEDIARITDWGMFMQQPLKVRRAIKKRLDDLDYKWAYEKHGKGDVDGSV